MPSYTRRGASAPGDVDATLDNVSLQTIGQNWVAAAKIMSDRTDLLVSLLSCKYTETAVPSQTGDNKAAFERQSAFGQPVAYRPGPIGLLRGLPLDFLDLRYTTTREYIRDSTEQQLDYQFTAALQAYMEAVHASAFKSLMWTARVRTNENGRTVANLHNGDGEPIPTVNNKVFSGPHSHVFTSGATTIDGSDLVALYETVAEHIPSGSARRVVIIGHPDDIKPAAKFKAATDSYDFVPSTDGVPFYTQSNLVGTAPSGDFNGLKVIGSFGPALLIAEPLMPAGYLLAVATSGPNSPDNVLGWRQHAKPAYQGLHLVPGFNADYPLVDSFWEASVGFGVRHRGGAAVMQITASSTYTPPSALAEAI